VKRAVGTASSTSILGVNLSQKEFARALEIRVRTFRNWEQGRRKPEGPAIALLKIAAQHER
jgi:putative transcriptional regulator